MLRQRLFLLLGAACCAAGLGLAQAGAGKGGWRVLFDGKDFKGWQNSQGKAPNAGWVIEEEAMVRRKGAGDIWTRERFGDFVLDLEFKTAGNSGVFIRTDNPRDPVQTGIEVQIDNPSAKPGKHSLGAFYDLVAPKSNPAKKGEWTRMVITARGPILKVEMNGQAITEMDLDRWTEPGKNPDGTKNKFKKALKDFARDGHIGFQDHGAEVAYRKVKIRVLDAGKGK
jgi:hypothetical protein